jgi:hypothetical protein
MDVHVPFPITRGLRHRGVTVLTSQEDGTTQLADPDLLDRATVLGHLLFTQDQDFLVEAAMRQQTGQPFAGVAFSAQKALSIGKCNDELEFLAKVADLSDVMNQVFYLPV